MGKAREFLDFWVQNSIQPAEQFGLPGASQDVEDLRQRCLNMAKGEGIDEAELVAEIGDLRAFLAAKLAEANHR